MVRLGRKKEAVAPLETYVKYCNDDIELNEGKLLLAEAKAP